MITEEESGNKIDEKVSEEELIEKFIEFIRIRKVVMLEDISATFRLTTKQVMDKIKTLEELKMLNGVTDDRGKYIYINNIEMDAIYKTIVSKGALSKTELIGECSRLIRMEPTEEEKSKIKLEENKL